MTSHTEPINIEQKLFEEAANFVQQRYPQGWGGAGRGGCRLYRSRFPAD